MFYIASYFFSKRPMYKWEVLVNYNLEVTITNTRLLNQTCNNQKYTSIM